MRDEKVGIKRNVFQTVRAYIAVKIMLVSRLVSRLFREYTFGLLLRFRQNYDTLLYLSNYMQKQHLYKYIYIRLRYTLCILAS